MIQKEYIQKMRATYELALQHNGKALPAEIKKEINYLRNCDLNELDFEDYIRVIYLLSLD